MSERGTTNGNSRGGSDARRRRRQWLVETYRANKDVVHIWNVEDGADPLDGPPTWVSDSYDGEGMVRLQTTWGRVALSFPACRCYRCGCLLTAMTVTVDRITPGCHGGTYRRSNIRPCCAPCNSSTGGRVRKKDKK